MIGRWCNMTLLEDAVGKNDFHPHPIGRLVEVGRFGVTLEENMSSDWLQQRFYPWNVILSIEFDPYKDTTRACA